jgi:membrane-bound serine protease (ClpP class)
VPGVIGLLCLFFIVLSSFALEAIHWLEPILLLFGLFLMALEFFFFPTLGLLGVIGALFTLAGLAGMMLPGLSSVEFHGDTLNAAGEYVFTRLGWLSASFLLAIVLIVFLSRFMTPHFRLMSRVVLRDTPMLATGQHEMHARPTTPIVPVHVNEEAVVSVTLRPAGKISVRGTDIDAVSTGNFIEKGKPVRIIRIEGEKIIVEEMYRP